MKSDVRAALNKRTGVAVALGGSGCHTALVRGAARDQRQPGLRGDAARRYARHSDSRLSLCRVGGRLHGDRAGRDSAVELAAVSWLLAVSYRPDSR